MVTPISFKNKTNFLSQKLFEDHYGLYKGYINKINEISESLAEHPKRKEANATESTYRGLKKGETYALDGAILHELYFENIGGRAGVPMPKTADVFNSCFGGLDRFKSDFTACGKSARGWVILAYEQRTQTFRNILLDSHDDGIVAMSYPILVMDMYEHAYSLDYSTNKGAYIEAFINDINWKVVENRIKKIV